MSPSTPTSAANQQAGQASAYESWNWSANVDSASTGHNSSTEQEASQATGDNGARDNGNSNGGGARRAPEATAGDSIPESTSAPGESAIGNY